MSYGLLTRIRNRYIRVQKGGRCMYILIGIIFIAIGVVMLVRPETVFQITESWKSYAEKLYFCAGFEIFVDFLIKLSII